MFWCYRKYHYNIQCKKLTVGRSEEHTSELQSQFRISYAVFCLKKKKKRQKKKTKKKKQETKKSYSTQKRQNINKKIFNKKLLKYNYHKNNDI